MRYANCGLCKSPKRDCVIAVGSTSNMLQHLQRHHKYLINAVTGQIKGNYINIILVCCYCLYYDNCIFVFRIWIFVDARVITDNDRQFVTPVTDKLKSE